MIEVVHKKKTFLVPESLDELSPAQFLAIVQVSRSDDDPLKGRLKVLRALLGMNWWRFRMVSAEQAMLLLPLTEWVEADMTLSLQLVPVIYADVKLYGPKSGFINVRAGEFDFADVFYTAWKKNGDEMDLYRFISVLYRPAKKGYDKKTDADGDIRQPFNPNLVEYTAAKLMRMAKGRLAPSIAYAALYCYEAWRMALETQHPRIFSKKAQRKAARYGWVPILRGVSAAGTYGNFDAVEQMYFGSLLMELEMLKDEEEELKRKHPELFKNKS